MCQAEQVLWANSKALLLAGAPWDNCCFYGSLLNVHRGEMTWSEEVIAAGAGGASDSVVCVVLVSPCSIDVLGLQDLCHVSIALTHFDSTKRAACSKLEQQHSVVKRGLFTVAENGAYLVAAQRGAFEVRRCDMHHEEHFIAASRHLVCWEAQKSRRHPVARHADDMLSKIQETSVAWTVW